MVSSLPLFRESCAQEVIAPLFEIGDDESGVRLLEHDSGIPSCSHADGFVTCAASGSDVERGIADHENVLGPDRIAVLLNGCFRRLSNELGTILRIGAKTAKTEILVKAAAL